ncbi:hypothetical protein GCM10009690_31930 [Brevibacterium permense]|uniref:ATP-binding protein n=2 Tax=Brevibacterium permense TaxID=234834 RepID=A0ABP4LKP3_9MICO
MALREFGPSGSEALIYDCFGNGSYRRPSAARHRAKQGLVQLSNELSARTLCDPLVPSATADDADYARAFLCRLETAATTIATKSPHALLTIVIDAADNAVMMGADEGERSFIIGLLREKLPPNVRLVVTCRTERRDRLELPPQHLEVRLEGFDLAETRAHLEQAFPGSSEADAAEFHSRTSHNPRVQATVLEATTTTQEALDWLASNPVSADSALDSIIERQIAEVRDSYHNSAPEIDQICVGLASLRPMIPVSVLAGLSGIDESLVLSFVTDLGRPLLIDSGTVQFRDEPIESWFREHYRPTGGQLDELLTRLMPLADSDAYVAASLPALLFEANRFDELVQLALSDRALPDNKLPLDQRNELQRREISQQRTKFALSAALRGDHVSAAAQLALRLGELTAGRTRRLQLICDNTDLSAQFLDPRVLEQLVATRAVMSEWPGSNLLYEAALLAGAPGQSDQARNRLRSSVTWVRAWTQQAARDQTESHVSAKDVMQIAWGLLNTEGPTTCIDYLRRWKPRTLAFDVGVLVARRLADAGRETDLEALALSARGKYTKFAIAQVCAERNLVMPAKIVSHLLKPVLKRTKPVRPSQRADEVWNLPFNQLVHEGLTAVIWLLTRALATQLISTDDALRVLDLYLPDDLGHRTGEWHHRDIWQPILGFALQASLKGRKLTATEIEGPGVTKARNRKHFESSRSLKAYEANVEPLVGWANLWIELQLEPSSKLLSEFYDKAKTFLNHDDKYRYHDEQTDLVQLNIAVSVIFSVLAEYPTKLSSAEVIAFCERNRRSLWRSTMILLVQWTSATEELSELATKLARQVHSDVRAAREDAREKANDLVLLARAIYQMSRHEAEVHFQAGLDVANAIGDDVWPRFDAFLEIARLTGETGQDDPGRAYRVGQISENLEEYLGDYLDHARVIRIAAGLSVPEALALASRWRDRRVAPITSLAEPFCIEPSNVLVDDPALTIALLPFCNRRPSIDTLAEVLKSSTLPAAPTIVALLRLWRTERPQKVELDRALEILGASRNNIDDIDPTLLLHCEVAGEPPENPGSKVSHVSPNFVDVDFASVEGWATALDRVQRLFEREALFDFLASVGFSAPIIEAFGKCPTVDVWHLSTLLERLESASLSMSAQNALDVALTKLLGRLSSDYLLVSYRSLDNAHLQALTGRDTDYGLFASRALADRTSFEPEEAFALAVNLTARLTSVERLGIFDVAASLFNDTAPTHSFDGIHPKGITENCDDVTAVACLIWNALGDPSPATRWLAAHAVRLLLSVEASHLAKRLHEVAMGDSNLAAFRDQRLPFYEKHATQWLVFALSRASLEEQSLHRVAMFAPLLQKLLGSPPHAVISPLASEVVLRLQRRDMIPAELGSSSHLKTVGRPMEVVRRSSRSVGLEVGSFSELYNLVQCDASYHALDDYADARPAGNNRNDEGSNEDTVEAPFNFFFDFRAYWCEPLGRAFGLTGASIERLVSEVLIEHWGVTSRGQTKDDPRHELRLYSQNTYSMKSDWPSEEDLDFYLAVQGLYEVAGLLLQILPVKQTYEEDEETGETEYSRFLSDHVLTRADGRWLSDRADPIPPQAKVIDESNAVGSSRTYRPSWPCEVNDTMFWDELLPEPERLSISVHRSFHDYGGNEIVQVNSALVAPATARSLLRALRTAPDVNAFRIPEAADRDFTSTVDGFELTGWVEERGYAEGIDSLDPRARGAHYPPPRPSTAVRELAALIPDADMRVWRDEKERIVLVSSIWADSDGRTGSYNNTGHQILIDRSSLSALLQQWNRWLIVEIQIRRYVDSSVHRTHDVNSNDAHEPSQVPRTKYFLIDLAGGIHDQ